MDILKKINYIFSRGQKIRIIILFFIMLGGAFVETLGVSLIMPFISVVTKPNIIYEQPIFVSIYNFFAMASISDFLIFLAALLIIVYVFKNIYLFFMTKLQFMFIYNNQSRLSLKMLDCYIRKPYEYHLSKNSAEITRGVTGDVSNLFILLLSTLLLISEVLVVLCIGIFLVIIDPFMAVAAFLIIGSSLGLFLLIYRKILREQGRIHQKSYGEMIKWVNQSLGGIKDIKVLNREQFFIDSYQKSSLKWAEANKTSSFLGQAPRFFIETLCVCSMLLIVIYLLYKGQDISTMIPQLSAFAMAAFRIMPSANKISGYANSIIYYRPSIDLVYRDLKENNLNAPKKTKKNETFKENPISIDLSSAKSIDISNLSFHYPSSTQYILNNVSFEIPVGKSIAFIGASGAGKTTFVDILLGLLQPTAGTVAINKFEVHKNQKEWSKKLGYIPQNIYLSDDTIRNNIAFGISEDMIDDEAINRAIVQSQLKSLVDSLPEVMNAFIGERGIKLSGGQRQRIGIARALYHDPEIIILDEATSALDDDTETAVMEAVDALHGKKTLIIIAHRLSTIRNCDLVFRIENEQVIEVNNEI